MIKGLIDFNRTEIMVLATFVILLCVGAGIRLYQKITEPSPEEVYIKTLAAEPYQPDSTIGDRPGQSPVAAAEPALRLNLNTAPAESLILLPRVGPVMTQRVIEYRDSVAGFDSVGQLLQVRGIGPKTLERIRPFVVVD
jgi:competence ComEA-like helix-hairpin-helix protein